MASKLWPMISQTMDLFFFLLEFHYDTQFHPGEQAKIQSESGWLTL